jgi:hypothetical protein
MRRTETAILNSYTPATWKSSKGNKQQLKIWLQGSYRDIVVRVNGTGIIDNNYGVPNQITFNKRSVAIVLKWQSRDT